MIILHRCIQDIVPYKCQTAKWHLIHNRSQKYTIVYCQVWKMDFRTMGWVNSGRGKCGARRENFWLSFGTLTFWDWMENKKKWVKEAEKETARKMRGHRRWGIPGRGGQEVAFQDWAFNLSTLTGCWLHSLHRHAATHCTWWAANRFPLSFY